MTRYLLDTNIVSDAVRPQPSPGLAAWLAAQEDGDLHISSLTLAEIRRGILDLPDGRKRRALEVWFDGPSGPPALFRGRILPFDEAAALRWAELMAEGRRLGRPRDGSDMIVAAVALAHGCVIVTGNERHFSGIDYLNPLRSAGGGLAAESPP